MAQVAYAPEANIAARFINHAQFGLKSDIRPHDRNVLEKIGDAGLWPIENLPRMTWNAATDPRVMTVGITALAMLADSYAFYPDQTTAYANLAMGLVKQIPLWAVRFGAYVATMEVIASYGARAEGRFTNKGLMKNFYTEGTVSAAPWLSTEIFTGKSDKSSKSDAWFA